MANELIVLERQLQPLVPHFTEALAGVMPVERLVRTAIVSAERNPYLLECDRQTFFNTIMSAGVLGLEMDGVTGQCFPVPFARKVQLIIGYKGYNTLGARAGLTLTGEVVREGDAFDYSLGTDAFVKHKPKLGNSGRIIGAWAQAAANDRPPVIVVMGIDELMAVKEKSPGGKKPDSPWNNPAIGFPAMCAKTAKRRLCRSTPLNVMQLAARMEEAFEEQGRNAFIDRNRQLVVDGDRSPIAPAVSADHPTTAQLLEHKPPAQHAPTAKPESDTASPISPKELATLMGEMDTAAKGGVTDLRAKWDTLSRAEQIALKPHMEKYKQQAEDADRMALS